MYHGRFKGTHYDTCYKCGELLYKNNSIIGNKYTFVSTEEQRKFANECLPIYEKTVFTNVQQNYETVLHL